MQKVAIIGAGVSGMSTAHFLKDRYEVTIFEKEDRPGGLIKCHRVNGNLFHTCGGHVFNSKRQDVLEWFWSKFQREEEFTKADRNSCVFMDRNGTSLEHDNIPYPIENHIYLFDIKTQKSFYEDLEEIDKVKGGPNLQIMTTSVTFSVGDSARLCITSIFNHTTKKCGDVI